jgi:hypothetical protein
MFNWFKKKEKGPTLRGKDIIWISSAEKWHALPAFATQHQPVVLVCWFQETLEKAKQAFAAAEVNITPQLYHSFVESGLENKTLILLEHYPLPEKEAAILSSLAPKQIIVLSALDEPLFMYFGGERLMGLMEKMGMAPGETIEHSMITASIKRAQEKLSSKVLVDFSARSQEEWFRRSGINRET